MVLTGSDTSFCYDTSESDYGNLPQGWSYKETAGVCVDEKDRVYVFSRSEHPVIVLDNTGKSLTIGVNGYSLYRMVLPWVLTIVFIALMLVIILSENLIDRVNY